MSNLFDSVPIPTVDDVPTLIYSPSVDAIAMSCLLTNSHISALPISVWIERDTGTVAVIKLAVNRRVGSGESIDALSGSKVALMAGDAVYAQCPVAGMFSGIISAYKDQ